MRGIPQFHWRHLSALSVAGFAAWSATTIGVWTTAAAWPSIAGFSGRAFAVCLLGLFLCAFVALSLSPRPLGQGFRIGATGCLIASTLGLLLPGPSDLAPILLIIVAVVLAEGDSKKNLWLGLLLVNICFAAIISWRWRANDPSFVLLVYGSFQAFAAIAAAARTQAEAVASQLRQVNAGLLATRALLAESARDAERLRVSRELHDVAGHRLTALKLNLEVLSLEPSIAVRREVQVAHTLTTELLGDIRSVVARLRDDDGIDIREALRRIAEPFPTPHIHLSVSPALRVDNAECADVLVRACQEALTNAARHAAADNIWVTLLHSDSGIELTIRDDGNYSGDHTPGFGLQGMSERVAMVDGKVSAGRSAQGGFEVVVHIQSAFG